MTARAGMSVLITKLRRLTNAGSADVVLAGGTYWSDDQLQTELDRTRATTYYAPMTPVPQYTSGSYTYLDYAFPMGVGNDIEQAGSASRFKVLDSSGSAIGTSDYSVNYDARLVTFTANTTGYPRYLDADTFDVNKAAAAVWRVKASFAANQVDWSSDNHSIRGAQEYEHCLLMAERFESEGGLTVGQFFRTDENV